MLAAGLLVAGTAWLALAVAERSPKLALTGGILGAGGLLIVLFEDGVSATTPAIADGLDHAAATGLWNESTQERSPGWSRCRCSATSASPCWDSRR